MQSIKVNKGDTLSSIARAHNTTVEALVKANNIQNPNLIYAGQTLKINDSYDAGSSAPAAFGAPASNISAVLKKGSSGASVTQMQQLLKKAGFDPGPIDGKFGPKTLAALKAFQKAKGLAVDGICGPKSWGALQGTGGTGSATSTSATGATGNTGGPGSKQVTQTIKGKTQTVNLDKITGGGYLRTDAAAAFNRMAADAAAAGIRLPLNSSFRSNAEQQALYNKYGSPRAAKPGYSNHEGGLSVDINVNAKISNWLKANAAKYGFKNDVANEPWHWTYYG